MLIFIFILFYSCDTWQLSTRYHGKFWKAKPWNAHLCKCFVLWNASPFQRKTLVLYCAFQLHYYKSVQVFTSTCNTIICNRAFFVPSAIFLDTNRLVAPVQFKMCPNLECHKYSVTLGWGLWTWHGVYVGLCVGLCLARCMWKIQNSKRVDLFGNKMSDNLFNFD